MGIIEGIIEVVLEVYKTVQKPIIELMLVDPSLSGLLCFTGLGLIITSFLPEVMMLIHFFRAVLALGVSLKWILPLKYREYIVNESQERPFIGELLRMILLENSLKRSIVYVLSDEFLVYFGSTGFGKVVLVSLILLILGTIFEVILYVLIAQSICILFNG